MTFIACLWIAYGAMGHSGGISVAFFSGFMLREHFSPFFSSHQRAIQWWEFSWWFVVHLLHYNSPSTEKNNHSEMDWCLWGLLNLTSSLSEPLQQLWSGSISALPQKNQIWARSVSWITLGKSHPRCQQKTLLHSARTHASAPPPSFEEQLFLLPGAVSARIRWWMRGWLFYGRSRMIDRIPLTAASCTASSNMPSRGFLAASSPSANTCQSEGK